MVKRVNTNNSDIHNFSSSVKPSSLLVKPPQDLSNYFTLSLFVRCPMKCLFMCHSAFKHGHIFRTAGCKENRVMRFDATRILSRTSKNTIYKYILLKNSAKERQITLEPNQKYEIEEKQFKAQTSHLSFNLFL